MKQFIIFAIFLVASSVNCQDGKPPTPEEIYCQAEYVLKNKLLDVPANTVNSFKTVLPNSASINCETVIVESRKALYDEVKGMFSSDPNLRGSANCIVQKMEAKEIHLLKFKLHALVALEVPNKDALTQSLSGELGDGLNKCVMECMMQG